MLIKSERLVLRPLTLADAARVTELIAIPEVISMLEQPPWPYELDDAKLWISGLARRKAQKETYVFAMDLPGTGLIGSIGLQKKQTDVLDLGYWIGKDFWAKGYGHEAASAIMNWAIHELNVTALVSGYFEDNPASRRILTRLGFLPTNENCQIQNPLRTDQVTCLGMAWRAQ